jgi:hypothetical protein
MTRGEAAALYKVPKGTVIRRIWQGWPPDKWFMPPLRPAPKPRKAPTRKGSYVTPYGRVTLQAIADIVGISYASMRGRLYIAGWPQVEAFNTPPHGKPGVHFIMPEEEYYLRRAKVLEADYQARLALEHQRRLAYNKKRKAKRLRERHEV